jgi:hypothetical protein
MREYLPVSSVLDLDLAKSVINWSTRFVILRITDPVPDPDPSCFIKLEEISEKSPTVHFLLGFKKNSTSHKKVQVGSRSVIGFTNPGTLICKKSGPNTRTIRNAPFSDFLSSIFSCGMEGSHKKYYSLILGRVRKSIYIFTA